MKHSPGPFRFKTNGNNRAAISDCNGFSIATLLSLSPPECIEGNGNLFAAAPELLEACKRLLKFNEELCVDVNVSVNYPSADFARKAIAKAEGK